MAPRSLPPLALAYHGVGEVPLGRDPHRLFVAPRHFRSHVERLRVWGYRLVTFGELARLAGEGSAEGHAALTFDDGPVDNVEALAPLLDELRVPATVFLVSGWLGRPYPWAPETRLVTEDEARALQRSGLEIGAHTRTHADLSALRYEEALDELAGSKRDLEEMLDAPVEVAAYPFGRASADTIRACRDAGFRAACRISGEGSWAEPHNLPRQDMDNGCTLLGLRLKRDDRYEPLMRLRVARLVRSAGRRMRAAVR